MERQTSQTIYTIGFWSAVVAAFFALAYDSGQLAEWVGLMGSGGGPENNSTWLGLVVLLVPSLFLGISIRGHDGSASAKQHLLGGFGARLV